MLVWLDARDGRLVNEKHNLFSIYRPSQHARYSAQTDPSGITLYGPPLPTSGVIAKPTVAASLIAQMRNSQIEWSFWRFDEETDEARKFTIWQEPSHELASLYQRLTNQSHQDLLAPLLDALDNPEQIISAHDYLERQSYFDFYRPEGNHYKLLRRADGSFLYQFDGLRVELSQLQETGQGACVGGPITVFSCHEKIDPAQFPALRAQWHRRLDKPIISIPYSRGIVGTALLPGLWCMACIGRLAYRRRLSRRNFCLTCGYDLRNTPQRCPECGTVPLGEKT